MTSLEASNLYEDESLDFVFLDASHKYDDLQADLKAWLPKVKNNGILAGHDYGSWKEVTNAVNDFFKGKSFSHNGEYCFIHRK
jgi:predicted O-methyltransferase YrrM